MTLLEAAKQALEALDNYVDKPYSRWEHLPVNDAEKAIINLRAAIEAAEKAEPVAWLIPGTITRDADLARANGASATPLYTHPAPAVPEGRYLDEETYRLQLKEAWESGFRSGLKEKNV